MTNLTFIEITKDFPQWREDNLVALAKDKRSGIYNLSKHWDTVEFWYKGRTVTMTTPGYAPRDIEKARFTCDGEDFGAHITAYAAAVVQLYFYLDLVVFNIDGVDVYLPQQ